MTSIERTRKAKAGERARPDELLLFTPGGLRGHRPSVIGPAVAACGLRLEGAQYALAVDGLSLCAWCQRSAFAQMVY